MYSIPWSPSRALACLSLGEAVACTLPFERNDSAVPAAYASPLSSFVSLESALEQT